MKLHYFGEDLNILGEEKYKKKKKNSAHTQTHRHTHRIWTNVDNDPNIWHKNKCILLIKNESLDLIRPILFRYSQNAHPHIYITNNDYAPQNNNSQLTLWEKKYVQ